MSNESKHDLVSKSITVLPDVANGEFYSASPPIMCSSFSVFVGSLLVQWMSLWTPRFLFALLAGQALPFSITKL